MRRALQLAWDMNVRAIPFSALWAVSTWLVLQAPSIIVKILGVLIANISALACSAMISRQEHPSKGFNFVPALRDRFMWKYLFPLSLLLTFALRNVSDHTSASTTAKYFFVAMALSTLALWLFAITVMVPIRASQYFAGDELATWNIVLETVKCKKGRVSLGLILICFGWPIIFLYVFLALTIAQALNFPESTQSANSSKSVGVVSA